MSLVYIYSKTKQSVFADIDDIVVLSPALYWFKVCEIPTKNMSKAKNIAMHMMSDRPDNFSEIVLYKKDAVYFAYAYDKKYLRALLKRLGLKNPKVYFANQLQLSETISVDDETNLYKFKNRVIESSASEVKPSKSLSANHVQLLQGEKPIMSFESGDSKAKVLLGLSAGIFFLYVLFFTFDKMANLSAIDREMAQLNNRGKSFYEIKSLINRYSKLDVRSNKLKEKFTKVLKDDNLKSLSYENGSFEVQK